jgi:hypothetical protein
LSDGVDTLTQPIADTTVLLYFISVVVMAMSIASFVINMALPTRSGR